MYPRSAKLVFDEADEAVGGGLKSLTFEGDQVRHCSWIMICFRLTWMIGKAEIDRECTTSYSDDFDCYAQSAGGGIWS